MIKNPILGTDGAQTGLSFFQKFIPAAINLSFIIAAVIFLFMLVTGAIQWISSGGEKGALEVARGKITNALIGIVILFSLYAVINLVSYFFFGDGSSIFNLNIAPLTQ